MPTNNEAEQVIRRAVLWWKVSLGVESEHGARFVERRLTQAMKASLTSVPIPAFQA